MASESQVRADLNKVVDQIDTPRVDRCKRAGTG